MTTPYVLEFTIQGLPPTQNASSRGRLRDRIQMKQDWKLRVWAELQGKKPRRPLPRAKLTLVRGSRTRPDFDGLTSSFKVIIDALRQQGVLLDDRHENIDVPDYRWEPAPARDGFIRVRVEEIVEIEP